MPDVGVNNLNGGEVVVLAAQLLDGI